MESVLMYDAIVNNPLFMEGNTMNKTIGDAAGIIWSFLDQQTKPVTLSKLKNEVDLSTTLMMMALGWLAREEKIIVEMPEDSFSYNISLKR
jgi:hypothetical protein